MTAAIIVLAYFVCGEIAGRLVNRELRNAIAYELSKERNIEIDPEEVYIKGRTSGMFQNVLTEIMGDILWPILTPIILLGLKLARKEIVKMYMSNDNVGM